MANAVDAAAIEPNIWRRENCIPNCETVDWLALTFSLPIITAEE